MVYSPHLRLTFSGVFGTIAAPYERWSFRLNTLPVTVGQDLAPALPEAVAAFTTHLAPFISSTCVLSEVKAARIGADGKYTDEATILEANAAGTGGASLKYPPQVSMAVSLMTSTRGSSGRGRFYLPGPMFDLSTGGVITAAFAQNLANAGAGFLGAINAIGTLDSVIVASTKGTNSVVNEVRVGRALDTIRSRRASIDEGYGAPVAVSLVAD